MRVSMHDVGRHLGLSRSTVSLALRGDPRIPAETRARVEKGAHELGYRLNSIISELASSHWKAPKSMSGGVLAYIDCYAPRDAKGAVKDSNWQARQDQTIPPMSLEAARLGYRLEVFHRSEWTSVKLQRTLRARGITDLILGPWQDETMKLELEWEKFVCVQLLPSYFPLPLHSVVRDYFNVVLMAWRKAVEHGGQRIGITLFEHPWPVVDDLMRLSATQACQNIIHPHLPVIPPYRLAPGDMDFPDFYAWVDRHDLDVIIGFSEIHHEVLQLKYGTNKAFICLNKPKAEGSSGVLDAWEECIKESVNLLHFCRRTYQWGFPKVRVDHVLEPTWYEGNSLPNLSNSRK